MASDFQRIGEQIYTGTRALQQIVPHQPSSSLTSCVRRLHPRDRVPSFHAPPPFSGRVKEIFLQYSTPDSAVRDHKISCLVVKVRVTVAV
jgi:hypothetical protein